MKKIFFVLSLVVALFLIVIPGVFAEDIDVQVEKISKNNVIIQDTEKPAILDINITNHGKKDEFLFWSYASTGISPGNTISLDKGESKVLSLEFYGLQEQVNEGNLAFNYYVKRKSTKESQKERMVVKIIKLKDALEIRAKKISPSERNLDIIIKNKVDYMFDNLSVDSSSPFFEKKDSLQLNPYEEKNLTVELNKEEFSNLLAGFYTLDTEIKFNKTIASYETPIEFVENEMIETTRDKKGFFINRERVNKTNKGNVKTIASITTQENIISRLFTTFDKYPDNTEREGGIVRFTWNKELGPGESLEVRTKTNWLYPVIIILLIVGIVYFIKKVTTKDIELRKKIRFVKTHGGEFGLKVSIMVKSNKYVENVRIKDKLPALAKIHEGFSGERPSVIDKKKRKIEWKFDKLEVGERRMVSYIIYSKIGVLGRFALPPATAFYETEGEAHESQSNRAYFIAEQAKKERN